MESVPIRYIFLDNQKPWFIHAEARVVSRSQESSVSNSIDKTHIRHCHGSDNSIERVTALIQGKDKKIKKSRAKSDSRNVASGQETCLDKREYLGPSTSEPETIKSLPSIARVAEMKNSECFKSFTPKPPERKPVDSESESIGKRITVAANNIRMQGKTHNSSSLSSSIFRSNSCRNRSLDGKIITSLAKFMVFEVPENED